MKQNYASPVVPTVNLNGMINHSRSDDWCNLLTLVLMQKSRDENDDLLFHSACHLVKQTSSTHTVNKQQSKPVGENVHSSCVVLLIAADFITNISQTFSLIPRCW